MGFCYKIFNCCRKKEVPVNTKSNKHKRRIKFKKNRTRSHQIIQINNSNPHHRIQSFPNNILTNEQHLELQFVHVQNTTEDFKILSNIPISSLIHSSNSCKENLELKYNCPICLDFFNNILVTSCCNNYICRLCAEKYLSTMIKYMINVKCVLCTTKKNIILSDVDPEKPVYHYF